MKIPVIILNYNSSNDCKKCLDYLSKQKFVELEYVVVDNCSAKEDFLQLKEFVREFDGTLIRNEDNRGYNAGNNVGLRYAVSKGYKYAMIANPDMEFPQENYISVLVAKIESDMSIAAVGSDIINAEGQHQNPFEFLSFKNEFLTPFGSVKNHCDYSKDSYCQVLSGCCLIVKLDVLETLGYFDERVFLYCEEVIFAKQIQEIGLRLFYTAETYAIHKHIKSQKGSPYKNLKCLFISRNLKNKYYSDYSPLQRGILRLNNIIKIFILDILILFGK